MVVSIRALQPAPQQRAVTPNYELFSIVCKSAAVQWRTICICFAAVPVQRDSREIDVRPILMTVSAARVKTMLPVLMVLICTPVPARLDTQVSWVIFQVWPSQRIPFWLIASHKSLTERAMLTRPEPTRPIPIRTYFNFRFLFLHFLYNIIIWLFEPENIGIACLKTIVPSTSFHFADGLYLHKNSIIFIS